MFGLLKLRSFRTQNKSDTKVKTRHPLSRIGGEKSAMRPSKRQYAVLGAKSRLYSERKGYFLSMLAFPAAQVI